MLSVEPNVDPKNKPAFLLDWEITLKCNLNCSYCGPEYHDNSTLHPPLDQCLETIDFMFEYVDLYMQYKSKWSRSVVMNVYGGESIFHPNILEIHKTIKQKHLAYADQWDLLVQTTTNLTAGSNLIKKLSEHIDSWTASYHSENTRKQKLQFQKNCLFLKQQNKKLKVIVLMHPSKFEDSLSMIEFCKQHQIDHLPRQLDDIHNWFPYNQTQIEWFDSFYNKKTYNAAEVKLDTEQSIMSKAGRACCGGRQLCADSNFKNRNFFIPNEFTGWSCSVNWFFLYVKQFTGNVYFNKDCRMNLDNQVGPIGNLRDSKQIVDTLRKQLSTNTMPVITCKKEKCYCGLCAPKAHNLETFKSVFNKYLSANPLTHT